MSLKSSRGRKTRGPVRQVILRIPEQQFAEMILLSPDMIDAYGHTRYGALQNYFLSLLMRDLEKKKAALLSQEKSE